MNDSDIQRIIEAIEQGFARVGISSSDYNKAINESTTAQEKQEKLLDLVNKDLLKYNNELKKGKKNILDFGSVIKDLDEKLAEMDDDIDKVTLELERNKLAHQYLTASYKKAGIQLLKTTGDIVVSGLIKGTKTLVSGLQNGSSGVNIAAGLMTDALDMQQKQVHAATTAMETMGQVGLTLAKTNKGRGVAGGLILLGEGIDYFSDKMTDLAKFGIEVLAKEVEKTVNAFNDATKAGAIMAGGMDDIRLYATRAGLSVDQFAAVIKNNSGLLAESGYTVGEAAQIIGNVTNQFKTQVGKSGQTLQREMLNLGYGFTEQAEITAQVVANMKRTGTGATFNRGEMAQVAGDLAKDMRKVADIMGEEYKVRQDAAKKATEQFNFYEMLVKRAKETQDPTLINRVQLAFAKMSESEQRARIQFAISGGAISDFTSYITGAADGAADFNNAIFNEVNPSLERLSKSSDELHDSYVQGGNEMRTAVGLVGGMGIGYGEQGAELAQLQQLAFKSNTETSQKAADAVGALAGAHGKLQDSVISAEIAAQDLRMALQKELTPAIEKFSRVANEILDGLKERIHSLGLGTGETPDSGGGGKSQWSTGAFMGGLALDALGGLAAFTPAAPLAPWLIGSGLAMQGAGAVGAVTGHAKGGIAEGPMSGYQDTLHGTEAVVPLPDNRSIPVSLDSSSLTAAINQNSSILNAILGVMKENNSISSQIVQNTY